MSYLTLAERVEQRALWLAGRVWPRHRAARLERQGLRDRVDGLLAELAARSPHSFDGTVIVDASWDNANYWVRYSLLRAALGLHKAQEIGYLGAFRREEMRRTLKSFGVGRILPFDSYPADESWVASETKRLLAATKHAEDVLEWELPGGYPAIFLYDAILKRQRLPSVDPNHPRFPSLVAFGLRCLNVAEQLIAENDARLLVVSAVNNFRNAPMTWLAARHGIPVVAVRGQFGVPRFFKVPSSDQIVGLFDRPTRGQIDALDSVRAAELGRIGRAYMEARRAGRTRDIGAVKAYRERDESVDRQAIRDHFGWSGDRPIIAIYAANWYDFPHSAGLRNFRDYGDWIKATGEFAKGHDSVNWLFKAHPNNASYPGTSLRGALPGIECGHVGFACPNWNNAAVMAAVDGIVSVHGSIGIEAPAIGTPVLLADQGWYHECGFAIWARTRDDYLEKLGRSWWTEIDREDAQRRVEIFAGWLYGYPAWQNGFLLPEDTNKNANYAVLPDVLLANADTIAREIDGIRAWFHSDDLFYHTAKMRDAESVVVSNIQA